MNLEITPATRRIRTKRKSPLYRSNASLLRSYKRMVATTQNTSKPLKTENFVASERKGRGRIESRGTRS